MQKLINIKKKNNMTLSKKLLLTTFGLHISFNGLAMKSNKPQISDFNPERDMQAVVDLCDKEKPWLLRHGHKGHVWVCHRDPNCHIKILRENNEFAGFIEYYDFPCGRKIDYLAVEQNFRNKGYGKKLLKYSIKNAHNKNMDFFEICTTTNNIKALNLYEKLGFKQEWKNADVICLQYDPSIIETSLSHLIKVQKNKEHL
jgi:ribosomal protein S18 acetylase RimI-like enzyme